MRNAGDAERLNLIAVDSTVRSQPPTRTLGSDREGRVYQSVGGARSKVEQTDRHDQAEQEFVADIAKNLSGLVRDENISNLVLVAPPRVLGRLRAQLGPRALRSQRRTGKRPRQVRDLGYREVSVQLGHGWTLVRMISTSNRRAA